MYYHLQKYYYSELQNISLTQLVLGTEILRNNRIDLGNLIFYIRFTIFADQLASVINFDYREN